MFKRKHLGGDFMISGVSTLFTYNALVLLVFILGWSFYAFRKKNYSLLEIGWPLSLVFVVWTSFLLFGAQSIYRRLLVLTVTIWGVRLAFNLYTLFWNKSESSRYRRLREAWEGKLSGLKAVLVLVVVPLLVYYVVSMILSIGFLDSQEVLRWWQYLGVALWALGMLFEIGSEVQLKKFLSKPENEGQMLTKGLWRVSRHPHYFGTAVVWWGIYLISIVDWNNLLGILSPIMMTLFATYLASRSSSELEYQEREDLQDYTRKTSQFLPFSAQIGRGFSSIARGLGRGLSKMTKASAGAVSSAAKKAKDSRKKDETRVDETDRQLGEVQTEETAVTSTTPTDYSNESSVVEDTTDQEWFKEDIPTENLASVAQADLTSVDETEPVFEGELTETNALVEADEEAEETEKEILAVSYELEGDTIATENDALFESILTDDEIIKAEMNEPLSHEAVAHTDELTVDTFDSDLVKEDINEKDSRMSAEEEVSEEIVAEKLEEDSNSVKPENLQNKATN